MRSWWLAAPALIVALHCYDLYDAHGVWRGVAFVNEDEWRFEMFDAQGCRTESGEADAFLLILKRLGLEVEDVPHCPSRLIMPPGLLPLGTLGAVEANGTVTFGLWLPWVSAADGNAVTVKIIHEADQFLQRIAPR